LTVTEEQRKQALRMLVKAAQPSRDAEGDWSILETMFWAGTISALCALAETDDPQAFVTSLKRQLRDSKRYADSGVN
jgi:hypothetical protein